MQNNNDIWIELNEISPVLAGMEKLNLFTIPDGYFENLPGQMLTIALDREAGLPDQLLSKNTRTVPDGYFNNLADQILLRIKARQEENSIDKQRALSPELFRIKNINVFEVPAAYFHNLAEEVMNKIKPDRAKLVVIRSRQSSFIKYAAAAIFTGLMALGVFKLTNQAPGKLDATVLNGLQINKSHSFEEEFAKVSDEDIIKYLEANGENVDAQLVASKTLDENELPNQSDYMNDDKTLDNYLNNMNSENLKN